MVRLFLFNFDKFQWNFIGLADNNIVLGKHSGRHAFRTRLVELGYSVSDDELNRAFVRFKELADKKKDISNADLESIVNDEIQMVSQDRFKIDRKSTRLNSSHRR